jgi:hypothetical protein
MSNEPIFSPLLHFDSGLPSDSLEKVRDNLSAIVLDGDHLWLGGDEGTAIHRMTRDATGNFSGHTSFELKDILGLPGKAEDEIDIEGLDVDGGYLWLIGSHSAKRKKPDTGKELEDNLKRLRKIELEGNRLTLARVPLGTAATPVCSHGGLSAARLVGDTKSNLLTDALMSDSHLGRFVPRVKTKGGVEGIPSKDNGLDVEGLAVMGDRVFLGLRGPVLRGWATIIELKVKEDDKGVLALETLASSGKPYLKHLLQLDGLSVRELAFDGNDLLVLSGPSMDLDGPVFIYRWKNALHQQADSMTWKHELTKVVTVPFGLSKDHAEGLSIVTADPLSVMVCYDSPATSRISGNSVKADVFAVSSLQ